MNAFTYTNESLNPWLLVLDGLLMAHFVYTYYRYCLRLGFKFDFWHFGVLTGGVLPVLINYVFAGAFENKPAVGSDLAGMQASLDRAFTIQITGYISMYIGFYYYNAVRSKRPLVAGNLVDRGVSGVALLFREFVHSDLLLYTYLFVTVAAGTALMAIAFHGSPGLNLRSLVFGDSTLRPVYNVCFVAAGPLILGAIWAKYVSARKRSVLVLAILMLLFQILSGARGPVIVPMGNLVAVYAVVRGRKVGFSAILIVMAILLTLAMSVQFLRVPGEGSANRTISALSDLAYGNEYPDTRDFAWLLSKWDGEYLYGRSYVAGAVALLPRAFFMTELRETWSFTFYQATFTHLDPVVHPGLRPGRYGEIYMNFGYPGVLVIGFLTGYVCRLIDDWIKVRNIAGIHDIVTDFSIAMSFNFFEPIYHSVSTWTSYMLILILASAAAQRALRRNQNLLVHSPLQA